MLGFSISSFSNVPGLGDISKFFGMIPTQQGTQGAYGFPGFIDPSYLTLPGTGSSGTGAAVSGPFGENFDIGSIIQGVGLGAPDVPKPPAMQDIVKYNQMLYDHEQELQDNLTSIKSDIAEKKDLVFEQYHYIFDENKLPQCDPETGFPYLEEGKETTEQQNMRLSWEKTNLAQLKTTQTQETKDFEIYQEELMKQVELQYPDEGTLEGLKAREEAQIQIEKEKKLLLMHQEYQKLYTTCGFLPDVNSTDMSLTINDSLTNMFEDFKLLSDEQTDAEHYSDSARNMLDYQMNVKLFTANQSNMLADFKQSIGYDSATSQTYSPEMYNQMQSQQTAQVEDTGETQA